VGVGRSCGVSYKGFGEGTEGSCQVEEGCSLIVLQHRSYTKSYAAKEDAGILKGDINIKYV
jgi:hypothetical protein